VRAYINYLQL